MKAVPNLPTTSLRDRVRLYEALIVKYECVALREGEPPPEEVVRSFRGLAELEPLRGETAAQALERARAEKLAHLKSLRELADAAIGDPMVSAGKADECAELIRTITDPATPAERCLEALHRAERSAIRHWRALARAARRAGQHVLCDRIFAAARDEASHLGMVEHWRRVLLARAGLAEAVD